MTREQEEYARQVHETIRTSVRGNNPSSPVIDIAVAQELGLLPSECAMALLGYAPKTLTWIIEEMKRRGGYNLV